MVIAGPKNPHKSHLKPELNLATKCLKCSLKLCGGREWVDGDAMQKSHTVIEQWRLVNKGYFELKINLC